MNNKTFEYIKPNVKFYYLNNNIYFECNNNLLIASIENIKKLKNNLEFPFKIVFENILINDISNILSMIINNDIKLYCYRLEDSNVIYNAILIKNEKIKKL